MRQNELQRLPEEDTADMYSGDCARMAEDKVDSLLYGLPLTNCWRGEGKKDQEDQTMHEAN
jgi:hypothetical protein